MGTMLRGMVGLGRRARGTVLTSALSFLFVVPIAMPSSLVASAEAATDVPVTGKVTAVTQSANGWATLRLESLEGDIFFIDLPPAMTATITVLIIDIGTDRLWTVVYRDTTGNATGAGRHPPD